MYDLTLTLPFPPTINHYYGRTARGVVYIRKAGKCFREQAIICVEEQLPGVMLDSRIHCEVVLHPPDRRPRDLDNYMKPLLDALTHSQLIEDDKLIDQLAIFRGVPVPRSGCVIVTLNDAGPIFQHKP